jgi:hypothetical protein
MQGSGHSAKYVKKPLPVEVEFASGPGVLETREGPVSYEAGDALMTGFAGERWPIRRAHFEQTYEPLAPLEMGQDGRYLKKPMVISARQADADEHVVLQGGQGTLRATRGDWIVESGDGQRWVVENGIFHQTYRMLIPGEDEG